MLFYLAQELRTQFSVFNVFRYITFRTGGALITAALFVFIFGQPIIDGAARHGKARASRSAPTGRRRISTRPARRPWAG